MIRSLEDLDKQSFRQPSAAESFEIQAKARCLISFYVRNEILDFHSASKYGEAGKTVGVVGDGWEIKESKRQYNRQDDVAKFYQENYILDARIRNALNAKGGL